VSARHQGRRYVRAGTRLITAVGLWLAVSAGLAQAQPRPQPQPRPQSGKPVATYTLMSDDGAQVVRALVEHVADAAPTCPVVRAAAADQAEHRVTMQLRVAAGVVPPRPTTESAAPGKGAVFPLDVCEAVLPRDIIRARIGAIKLPISPRRVDRIVVIGDTGCRLKGSEKMYQDCKSPQAWPFAEIARQAAAWKPDLVVHVGDYIYRESPCPDDHPGCAGTPYGGGWDSWNADLFTPGAPLLQAAPWVVVRGNHEDCARGGIGWYRLLDPHPMAPGRDCTDPAKDAASDYTAPYAVPIGGGAQVVVLDLTAVGEKPLAEGSSQARQVGETWDAMAALSRQAPFSFVANHKPILGFGAQVKDGVSRLRPGNAGPQAVFAARDARLFPDTVQVLLSGHLHIWEQLSFSTPQPTQFIAGFSGTLEDTPEIPEHPPAGSTPWTGAVLEHFSVWNGQFGFMTLERVATDRWTAKVHDLHGNIVRTCQVVGRTSSC